MRYWIFGVALAGLSVSATAEDSAWGFFTTPTGGTGAGVQATDGSQLLLKCDKPGKHSVFAVVVSPLNLAAPLAPGRYESAPVAIRLDAAAPWDDNWRFNDKFAMAVDQGNTRSLTRFLEKLQGASTFDIRMKPVGKGEIQTNFSVAGAKDAITKVYTGCKDDNPIAAG